MSFDVHFGETIQDHFVIVNFTASFYRGIYEVGDAILKCKFCYQLYHIHFTYIQMSVELGAHLSLLLFAICIGSQPGKSQHAEHAPYPSFLLRVIKHSTYGRFLV